MRNQKLSTVTCHVIRAYGNTAKHAITAYRTGGERVVGFLEQRWNRSLKASRSRLSVGVARNASAVHQRLQQLAVRSLNVTSGGAQGLVNQVVRLADVGVHSVADNALWLQDKVGTTALTRLSQFALPAATVLSDLADQVESKSATLARKIARKQVVKKAVKRARPAMRKATKAAKAAVAAVVA